MGKPKTGVRGRGREKGKWRQVLEKMIREGDIYFFKREKLVREDSGWKKAEGSREGVLFPTPSP